MRHLLHAGKGPAPMPEMALLSRFGEVDENVAHPQRLPTSSSRRGRRGRRGSAKKDAITAPASLADAAQRKELAAAEAAAAAAVAASGGGGGGGGGGAAESPMPKAVPLPSSGGWRPACS